MAIDFHTTFSVRLTKYQAPKYQTIFGTGCLQGKTGAKCPPLVACAYTSQTSGFFCNNPIVHNQHCL
jgi:hypothetical protein